MSEEKIKKSRKIKSKKISAEISTPKIGDRINLNIASNKENNFQKSPHILNLNEIIKERREKNFETASSKVYYKETLYNFWTNKEDQKFETPEGRNTWQKTDKKIRNKLKLIYRKAIDLPKKIKVKLIDLKLSLEKRKEKQIPDFAVLFYQKPLPQKEDAEETFKPATPQNVAMPLAEKESFFDRAKFDELAIVNFIQLLALLLINLIKLIKKISFSLRDKALNLIPLFLRKKIEIISLKIKEAVRISPPQGWPKAIAGFTTVAIVLTLPFQALTYYNELQDNQTKIIGLASEAFKELKLGQKETANLKLESAEKNFKKAEAGFIAAESEIDQINFIITNLIKTLPERGKTFKSGESLIALGKNISEISQSFADLINVLNAKNNNLTEKIILSQDKLNLILPKLDEAINNSGKVEASAIPKEDEERFINIKGFLPLLKRSLEESLNLSDLFLKIIGQERTKRYLIIFQNNSEIRPTGGFIGSFALIDIDRGKIKKMEIPAGGSYDLKGGLKEKVISPEPLHLINPHWQFQDANWFADFPASAQKLAWFYEKSGGPSVDGVIALNATLIKDILKITGPIEMPEYNKIIDSQNFLEETQKAVEIEYRNKDETKPKQFISDLAPKLIDKFINIENDKIFDTIFLFQNALQNKNLIIYLAEPEIEQSILDFGWGGEIKLLPPKTDYLFIVNANVAGGKTDSAIKQTISHQSDISEDGTIIDSLAITKTHQGKKDDFFTGIKNIDYLRVYVPQGSILLEAKGFEKPAPNYFLKPEEGYKIDSDLKRIEGSATADPQSGTIINNEFGKTVFSNWIQLEPGETKTVILRYKIPFKLKTESKNAPQKETWLLKIKKALGLYEEPKNLIYYAFLAQKQPGVDDTEITSVLNLPKNLKIYFKYPSNLTLDPDNNKSKFSSSFESDESYGLIFEDSGL